MKASFQFEIYDLLPSTSDRAIILAQAGAQPWTAVLAREQTAGRGRHGRRWVSARGNLFLSVVLDPHAASHTTAWSFIAAVATADAILPLLHDRSLLRLKWPNDILLDGAKLGGILIETGGSGPNSVDWAVAGIGVNLVTSPAIADQPAIALCDRAAAVPPVEDLAATIVQRLQAWTAVMVSGGLGEVLEAWQHYSFTPGTQLRVRLADRVLQGRYLGLGSDGALLLETADGAQRSVAAGEVM